MQPTVLASWSGGIDSTSCLWQLLREGRCVLAHHVRLVSREGRQPSELRAVESIRAWLKEHGLTNYVYVETGWDYGNYPYMARDVHITGLTAGVILARHPAITHAVVSASADDHRRLDPDPTIQNRRRLLTELMAGCWLIEQGKPPKLQATRRELAWLTPNILKTKAQVMAEMPPDLLALCWYCRRPKNGRRCETCPTCKQVMAAEGSGI